MNLTSRIYGALLGASYLVLNIAAAYAQAGETSSGSRQVQSADHIEDIVVSARRRTESAQTVPISITAISADKLERQSIVDDRSVLRLVPSVGVMGYGDGTYIAIRGQFGSGAVVPYINEVPEPSDTSSNDQHGVGIGGPAMFYDMESLSVLKGPQGTLFGRNTTGGAVLYVTKKPTNEFGASIEGEYGNYNSRSATAVLNTPLVDDKLLFRAAGFFIQRDGYTHVLSTPQHPNGTDLDNQNAWSARASLTMKPSDNFQNDIMFAYMRNSHSGPSSILRGYNPTFLGGLIPLLPNIANEVAQQNALGPRTQIPIVDDPRTVMSFITVTDTMKYNVTDNITLKNIANYSQFRNSQLVSDLGGVVEPLLHTAFVVPTIVNQISEEFQVQGKSFENKLNWTAGAFFYDAPPQTGFGIQTNVIFGAPSFNEWREGDDSKAIYAQGTYDLSSFIPGLNFTAGGRYTWDRTFLSERNNVNALSGPLACTAADQAARPNSDNDCTQTGQQSFHTATWQFGFDYRLNDRTLTYITTRRGYREGGLNVGSATHAYSFYQPEFVTDLEVGVKSDWSVGDVQIRTNLDGYRQWYTNIQAAGYEPDVGGTNIVSVTLNGPHAIIQGIEFEGLVAPARGVELGATLSYLSPKFTYGNLPIATIQTLQAETLADRPKWKYTLHGTYHLPVDENLGDISVSADWIWQSRTSLVQSLPSDFDMQGAYGLLNLSLNWDHLAGRPLRLSFFMDNVTDKTYADGAAALTNLLGTATQHFGAPRMFGARLKYSWGGEAG